MTGKFKRVLYSAAFSLACAGAAAAAQPDICVMNSNLEDVEKKTPEIFHVLELMKKLPLTGAAAYETLKNPVNSIQSCLVMAPEKRGFWGLYESRVIKTGTGHGTSTQLHENFHAWQDITLSGSPDKYALTVKDAAVLSFLREAVAVAYEMAAAREAENLGLKTVETVFAIPSNHPENLAAFDAAYDAALGKGAGEAQALEAGGKAVVRRLLAGQDAAWVSAYIEHIAATIKDNIHILRRNGQGEGYEATRRSVYGNQGAVSPEINFTPDEYLGPDAARHTDQCLANAGFAAKMSPPPPAPLPKVWRPR